MLNTEGIPGPRGGAWDKSAIHGNPKRGTGILNNEIYIGKLIWNRQRFVKDPQTGKRQARPNPAAEWITADVPDMRIVDQDLWDKAKSRQEGRRIEHTEAEAWERRKPRFLLTGLVKCGCCGGGFRRSARTALVAQTPATRVRRSAQTAPASPGKTRKAASCPSCQSG
jgi:hypothetical protein